MNDGTPVWFITGCSTGLGRALAATALERGHRVAATARDPHTLADLVADHGDQALALALDVTDPAQIAEAVKRAGPPMRQSATVIDDYAETAGARRAGTLASYGRQPGDPLRAAAAVIDAVESAEPPLRLLLGRAAYDIATARLDGLRAGFDAWKEVTLGADYPAA